MPEADSRKETLSQIDLVKLKKTETEKENLHSKAEKQAILSNVLETMEKTYESDHECD